MSFEFATAARIVFGPGARSEVAPAAARLGRRALLVTGRRSAPADALQAELQAAGVTALRFAVSGEPDLETISAGAAQARQAGAEMVISLGGGSALDTGKAVAALLTNQGELLDYLEVIGRGQPLANDPAPFIAVPTTAGTGSEVTRNATLLSRAHRLKVSLRSPRMLARLAVVDPELTYSMPPQVTAYGGLDALTQLIEPFVSNAANPLTDALCRQGIPLAGHALPRAYADGAEPAARADMALASLLGGMALANARLGAVHGLAGPLGGWLAQAPHGALCARLLPIVVAANLKALRARAPASPALARYGELAKMFTGLTEAAPGATADVVEWLQVLVARLNVPPLSDYGLTAGDIPALVPQAQQANSMRGNPIALTDAEVAAILEEAL